MIIAFSSSTGVSLVFTLEHILPDSFHVNDNVIYSIVRPFAFASKEEKLYLFYPITTLQYNVNRVSPSTNSTEIHKLSSTRLQFLNATGFCTPSSFYIYIKVHLIDVIVWQQFRIYMNWVNFVYYAPYIYLSDFLLLILLYIRLPLSFLSWRESQNSFSLGRCE